jgi:hypothetical protein
MTKNAANRQGIRGALGLVGVAGAACVACCAAPLLVGVGLIGTATAASFGQMLPVIIGGVIVGAGLIWWAIERRKSAHSGCADGGCSCASSVSNETSTSVRLIEAPVRPPVVEK